MARKTGGASIVGLMKSRQGGNSGDGVRAELKAGHGLGAACGLSKVRSDLAFVVDSRRLEIDGGLIWLVWELIGKAVMVKRREGHGRERKKMMMAGCQEE
ncbi:hypothetical protein M0R45_000250 [Rubus argutus]|uniref:Uncharacterized protein n=1 Tax=Rubus argutus TaxID=59490 RepID=A0AAW1VPS7_RUBAR